MTKNFSPAPPVFDWILDLNICPAGKIIQGHLFLQELPNDAGQPSFSYFGSVCLLLSICYEFSFVHLLQVVNVIDGSPLALHTLLWGM